MEQYRGIQHLYHIQSTPFSFILLSVSPRATHSDQAKQTDEELAESETQFSELRYEKETL